MEMRLVVEPGMKRRLVIFDEQGHRNEWITNMEITAGDERPVNAPKFKGCEWILLDSKGE